MGTLSSRSPAHIQAAKTLPVSKASIEVVTRYAVKKPAGPLEMILKVNSREAAKELAPVSAPVGFAANDCLDDGSDLGSPVSLDYFDEAPFEFNGGIERVHVRYTVGK